MLYPEPDGPIKIYLTNPFSNRAWQQFFTYWLKIEANKEKKPGNDKKKSLFEAPALNDKEVMRQLEDLCKQEQKDDSGSLGYKAIKDLTKLSYDSTGRYYQF